MSTSTRTASTGPDAHSQGRPPGQREWALAVHKRSGWRCQGPGCGLTKDAIEALGGQLQAAHIWPWRDCADPLPPGVLGGPTLGEDGRPLSARFDPRNGLSACTFKNRRHPAGIGNGYGCHAVIDRWGSKVPPGVADIAEPGRGTIDNLFGSPLSGTVTLPRLVAVWFAQGFAVFSFEVVPLWVLFAVYVLGGLGSPRQFAWWLFSMIPATLVGLYGNRYAHRTYLPSRALRACGAALKALVLAAFHGIRTSVRKRRG